MHIMFEQLWNNNIIVYISNVYVLSILRRIIKTYTVLISAFLFILYRYSKLLYFVHTKQKVYVYPFKALK